MKINSILKPRQEIFIGILELIVFILNEVCPRTPIGHNRWRMMSL